MAFFPVNLGIDTFVLASLFSRRLRSYRPSTWAEMGSPDLPCSGFLHPHFFCDFENCNNQTLSKFSATTKPPPST
jgi:hypothetical protein